MSNLDDRHDRPFLLSMANAGPVSLGNLHLLVVQNILY